MRRPLTTRKCKHCKRFFDADPRRAGRQRSCAQPACRTASHPASHRRWLQHPNNHDSFSGPAHVERVRQWRQAHPGDWRRQASHVPEAFQDPFTPQAPREQPRDAGFGPEAFQEAFFMQPAIFVGLSAPLTGLSFQEDLAVTARRLPQWGRDILCGATPDTGGFQEAQTPPLVRQPPAGPQPVQLGRSALSP